MKRTHKELFKGVYWGKYYTSERPVEKVAIDGDSIVFRHILDFRKQDVKVSAMNNLDTDTLLRVCLQEITQYSVSEINKILEIFAESCVLVFGEGYIPQKHQKMLEREEERRKSYKSLSLQKGRLTKERNAMVARLLKKHLITLRDDVVNMVKSQLHSYETSREPDIYCPSVCPVVLSEDYDLFLFGAEILIKEVTKNEISFLSREKMLKHLQLDSVEQLVIASVLCGTDYNVGVRGIGPVKSKKIATLSPDDEIIDQDAVRFFTCSREKGSTSLSKS